MKHRGPSVYGAVLPISQIGREPQKRTPPRVLMRVQSESGTHLDVLHPPLPAPQQIAIQICRDVEAVLKVLLNYNLGQWNSTHEAQGRHIRISTYPWEARKRLRIIKSSAGGAAPLKPASETCLWPPLLSRQSPSGPNPSQAG